MHRYLNERPDLMTPLGHPLRAVNDASGAIEETSKLYNQSSPRAGEGERQAGGAGEEDDDGHQEECKERKHGGWAAPPTLAELYRTPVRSSPRISSGHGTTFRSLHR